MGGFASSKLERGLSAMEARKYPADAAMKTSNSVLKNLFTM
jgi:hypothetical protein